MDVVNESLEAAPSARPPRHRYPGPHVEGCTVFQAEPEAGAQLFVQPDKESAEALFKVLNDLVKQLPSQENIDRNWLAVVLDVRQHVEFVAIELDESGLEIEVYRSGAGKSGGQRQKLAAALRYQLGASIANILDSSARRNLRQGGC